MQGPLSTRSVCVKIIKRSLNGRARGWFPVPPAGSSFQCVTGRVGGKKICLADAAYRYSVKRFFN